MVVVMQFAVEIEGRVIPCWAVIGARVPKGFGVAAVNSVNSSGVVVVGESAV